jgi:hypothetical protein
LRAKACDTFEETLSSRCFDGSVLPAILTVSKPGSGEDIPDIIYREREREREKESKRERERERIEWIQLIRLRICNHRRDRENANEMLAGSLVVLLFIEKIIEE